MNDKKNINSILRENIDLIRKIINSLSSGKDYNFSLDDKDDIFQIVCEKLLAGGIENFRGQSKFSTYLYVIIKNEVVNYYNKHYNPKYFKEDKVSDFSFIEQLESENLTEHEVLSMFNLRSTIEQWKFSSDNFAHKFELNELIGELLTTGNSLKGIDSLIFKWYFIDGKTQEEVAKLSKRSQATIAERITNIRKVVLQEIKKKYGANILKDLN